jgi:hypothetical protein
MTEARWLAHTDPVPMLNYARGRVSDRKLRLFAVACCRRVAHRSSPAVARVIDVNERFADGRATARELGRARGSAFSAASRTGGATSLAAKAAGYAAFPSLDVLRLALDHALEAAGHGAGKGTERRVQCQLLREVAGNPFRPPTLDPALRAWKDGLLVAMVQAIYDEKRFGDLPILADALEEAGCTGGDLLAHCREGGEHVRGCWAVDLLLAKT